MPWFRRAKKGIKSGGDKRDMPQGVWLKCKECSEILYRPEMEKTSSIGIRKGPSIARTGSGM